MAVDNCANCPNMCFGNLVPSDCVEYNGFSLKSHLDGQSNNPVQEVSTPPSSTDDIVSNSILFNRSSVCSSHITNREFEYTLSVTSTGGVFGWNMSEMISTLPSGYRASVIRVKVYGNGVDSKNLIADTKARSSGVGIKTNQFPMIADFLVRVSSPCGDIDMEQRIEITGPSRKGTYKSVMKVSDLNPVAGQISLTDQLSSIESKIYEIGVDVENMPDATVSLEKQQIELNELNNKFTNLGDQSVSYRFGGNKVTDSLSAILQDLYTEIASLKQTVATQEVEISTLKAQVDSINAGS